MAYSPTSVSEFPAQPTALVTGAASARGIGRAIAHRLARDDWAVAIFDLDDAASKAAAREVAERYHVPTTGTGVDITDEAAVEAAIQQVVEEMPPLIGLVNNAGVSSPTPFLEVLTAEWRRVMTTNVDGAFFVTRAAVREMVRHRLGRIVNISSASAERGGGVYGRAAYSGSKAAILGITRTLARELGEFGITVNAVAPGSIDTDIMGGRLSEQRKLELIAEIPVGRIGTVDDVAAVVNFLLGREAGYLTGVTYDVNGGSHIA